MESSKDMLLEKLGVQNGIHNNQLMLMEKLGVLGILKEAIKIPYKCPKFIFLTFLTSLPLILIMVLHEIILQTSMVQTKSILAQPEPDGFYYHRHFSFTYSRDLETTIILLQNLSPKIFQLGFLYLVPLHLLNLLNTIIIVNSASRIYTERSVKIGEMLLMPIKETGFRGPLTTSIYVLLLNSLVLFTLIWAATNSMFPLFAYSDYDLFSPVNVLRFLFLAVYLGGSIMLTVKWIEWTALWNMSIVSSVLDSIHGVDALGASGYFSRGNAKRGLQLMLLFFVWRVVLRLSSLYIGGHEQWAGLVVTSFLSCIGNVMKWIVCTVYFYDCKKRTLEKKVDLEEGGKIKNADKGSTEGYNIIR